MKTVYTISETPAIDLDTVNVGDQYILVSHTDTMTQHTYYTLAHDNGAGISGNMNSNIKRYHGWRGTTGDVSVCAEGLHRVERIDYVKDLNAGTSSIPDRVMKLKLSPDLVPDKP